MQFAPINPNGTLGSWTATTSLTTTRNGHTAVAYNGYLYVLGGYNDPVVCCGAGLLNTVEYAPINANGTLGSWTATTSLTTARRAHTSVAYNGYLYVLGGTGPINTVEYAPINANGTIGAWSATSSLTAARQLHTSVAYNGYLYVLGGDDGTGAKNTVQFALINANGTLGSWSGTTSLPAGMYRTASVVYNGYVYMVGGIGNATFAYVQFAAINTGALGAWTATSSFTQGRYSHTSVAYNGYLYVLGGYSSTTFSDVQYAPSTPTAPSAPGQLPPPLPQ